MPPIPYTDAIESPHPNESQTFDEIAATMLDIAKKVGERQRHTVRAVHAKSHGLLQAEVTVMEGLPDELRQGLFATPASYPAILRLSTNPGDILSDHISTPRGMAMKIIGVEGEMLPNHAGQLTQDFVMVNAKSFAAPNADAFLKSLKQLLPHVDDSEALKQTVSSVAQVAESALELVGTESAALKGFGHPPTHPLGETFSTVTPIRFGQFVAKLALVPVSQNLTQLTGKPLPHAHNWNALKDAIVAFFATQTAIWELRVQLCTDLEKMPVEDASTQWDESLSPYIAVAQVTVTPQNAYSDARRVFVDELLSFNPWHALAAHRPLGNIMRARFKSYRASSHFRHTAESRPQTEPRSIQELPA
jgi:hypothetical protein